MSAADKIQQRLAAKTEPSEVAKADGAGPPSAATLIQQVIKRQATAFDAVMPANFDGERFSRLVVTAVKANPRLMDCFATDQGQVSLLLAAMQAASIGLEPNTPTQECWLQPRKDHGVETCELSVGYRGYIKLAMRSPNIKSIDAQVVHENDWWRYERGLEADVFEFVPFDEREWEDGVILHEDAGAPLRVYCLTRFMRGGYNLTVLTRRQVHERRASSPSWANTKSRPYCPWEKFPESMWRKSAVRAAIPFLDLQAEVALVNRIDEGRLEWDAARKQVLVTPSYELAEGGDPEAVPEPVPAADPKADPPAEATLPMGLTVECTTCGAQPGEPAHEPNCPDA